MRESNRYNLEFKKACVQKMLTRGHKTVTMVGNECGVATASIYKWIHQFGNIVDMKTVPTQPNKRSGMEKVKTLCEYANLPEDKQGEFIRSRGLHLAHLNQWRQQAEEALSQNASKRLNLGASSHDHKRQMKEMEKELKRLQAALAEVTALFVLKKKAQSIWGAPE